MKILKKISYGVGAAAMILGANSVNAQIIGTEAYTIGDYVEYGINADGHEGAPDLPGSNARSSAWAGSPVYFGFVANPQMDGWGNYDGDFFSPGSPENGFGIEIAGTNYSNNASGWPAPQIPGSITDYTVTGDCIEVDWDGSILGLDVNVHYKLLVGNVYYTTTVTLTNTTAATMTDLYYYRNFDPDNNHSIGGGFPSQQTIVDQPSVDCEKAFVSATQPLPWPSFVGLGGLGQKFQVNYGGFSNRDGSDIWNHAGWGFVGTVGSTLWADQAISLAYKTTLAAGASEEFTFAIVMDEASYDEAMGALFTFSYSGGGIIDECDPTTDSLEICPGASETIEITGPGIADYDWTWSPPAGLSTTTGPTTDASPAVTTTYTVTGASISCVSADISKDIVVKVLAPPAGPDVTDDLCNTAGSTLDLHTHLIPEALAGGGTWEESSVPPSGGFDPATGEFDAEGVIAGSYTFDYIVMTMPPCPEDTATITVNVHQQVEAGDDNTAEICNNPGSAIDLTTLLSGDADAGGVFTEGIASGGFDGTSTLDGDGVTPSDYTYTYTVAGVAPCPDDFATFTVTVLPPPPVEAFATAPFADIELCEGETQVLAGTGAGPGGVYVWDNGITDGLPFSQDVGTVTYTVTGTDINGCWNTDDVTVIVHPTPEISFIADEVNGCTPFDAVFTPSSDPAGASCYWKFGDGSEISDCGSVGHRYENEGDYDVTFGVTSIHGCVNEVTYADYIHVIPTPEAEFQWSPTIPVVGDTEVEFSNGSLYSTTYEWDFGDGSPLNNEENPKHEFPTDVGNIDYEVTLTSLNEFGCSDTYTAYVHINDEIIFYIPNVFSPDGDEYNETFKPVFYSGIDPYDFHMTIWNRYGEVIFESYNPAAGWDGTYGERGLILDGTYIWQLDFKENNSDKRHKHHGHVTILK